MVSTSTQQNQSSSSEEPMNHWYWLLPLLLVLCVSWYFTGRYQGHWAEYDTCSFANMIRVFLRAHQIVPDQGEIYEHGFGYQSISTFIITMTGLDVATLQQKVYPLLMPLIFFPAWALYREFTGSPRGAAISAVLLFTQPEFLFVVLRSSHEKFTRSFILICILLLARSLRLRNEPRLFAAHVGLFYIPAIAMMTGNVALAMSFLIAVNIAMIGAVFQERIGWVRDIVLLRVKRIFNREANITVTHQYLERQVIIRLIYAVFISFILVYLYAFYIYRPAQHSLGFFQKIVAPKKEEEEVEEMVITQDQLDMLLAAEGQLNAIINDLGESDNPANQEVADLSEQLIDNIKQSRENPTDPILQMRLNVQRALLFAKMRQTLPDSDIELDEESSSILKKALENESIERQERINERRRQASSASSPSYDEYIKIEWRHRSFFFLLGLGNWIVLLGSGFVWGIQGLMWIWKGKTNMRSPGAWLLWLLYAAYSAQIVLAYVADQGGSPGGNTLQRILPSISMFAVPMIGSFLNNMRLPRVWMSRTIWLGVCGLYFLVAMLSIFKATNEPVFKNKWTFYRPQETAAMVWADHHMDNAQGWAEIDERLWAAFRLKVGKSVQEGVEPEFMPFPTSFRPKPHMRDLMVSEVARLRSTRMGVEIPLPPDAHRVYDNGKAEVYHMRARTPHQE